MDARGFAGEGGCLCGAVRFRVSGPAKSACYCHCRSCRLASGAPSVAWATFPARGFQRIRGELAEVRSSEAVVRGFCGACGTSITFLHRDRPEELDVTLASLDDASALPEPRRPTGSAIPGPARRRRGARTPAGCSDRHAGVADPLRRRAPARGRVASGRAPQRHAPCLHCPRPDRTPEVAS